MTAWKRVRAALRRQDGSLITVITALTAGERREVIRELPAYQRERREASRWQVLPDEDRVAIRLAGVGCAGGPAAAATWLFRRGLEVWPAPGRRDEVPLAQVVADRPVEWRLDLARRVSARLRPDAVGWAQASGWRFAARLLRDAGAEPPADPAFVLGWVTQTPPVDLRDDPFLDALVPLLFEADRTGRALARGSSSRSTWETELVTLVQEGRLKRETLLDGCLRRFLRGGSPADLKWFAALHETLAPTPAEASERVRDYLRLLPTAPAPVAESALRQVRRVDEAGGLDDAAFAEAAEALLFRPEKKLVRAALSWLGRTPPDRVGATLAALTVAFGQEAIDLQERAVKLVVKLAPKAGEDALAAVRDAAATLPADLRERVSAACGTVEPVEAASEPVGVAPFVPRPLPAPIGSVAELAEEVARLFASRAPDAAEGERLIAGLVHFAHHAPEETSTALGRVVAAHSWGEWMVSHDVSALSLPHEWLGHLVGVAIRRHSPEPAGPPSGPHAGRVAATAPPDYRAGAPHRFMFRRITELAGLLGRTPLLLSTPTSRSGHVDPAELVTRLERLEEAALRPGEADLEQALLRLPRACDPEVVTRARRLSSPAGHITANALASGGLPDPRVATGALTLARRTRTGYPSYEVKEVTVVRVLATVVPDDRSGPAAALFRLPSDGLRWNNTRVAPHAHVGAYAWWPSVLPSHREVIAAHLLPPLADWAEEIRLGVSEALPGLAEADGPAGDALATVLAYGLAARDAEERSAAVDALLVLAGRGRLPATELGVAIGRLSHHGLIKVNRVAEALTGATDAGAATEVWTALTTALPDVLPGEGERPRTGVPALLALAARCAETTGARADLPELTAVVARGGSTRLVQEARRLHRVLTVAP